MLLGFYGLRPRPVHEAGRAVLSRRLPVDLMFRPPRPLTDLRTRSACRPPISKSATRPLPRRRHDSDFARLAIADLRVRIPGTALGSVVSGGMTDEHTGVPHDQTLRSRALAVLTTFELAELELILAEQQGVSTLRDLRAADLVLAFLQEHRHDMAEFRAKLAFLRRLTSTGVLPEQPAAVQSLIFYVIEFAEPDDRVSLLRELFAVSPQAGVGPEGFAPLHVAAVCGDTEMVELVLAHTEDPNVPLSESSVFSDSPFGGLVSVAGKPGMTALDLLDRARLRLERTAARDARERRDLLAGLIACRALLVRAGVRLAHVVPPLGIGSFDLVYDVSLEAHLVAGRTFYGDGTQADLQGICGRVDELAADLDVPLVVIASGPVGDAALDPDAMQLDCVIGVHIAMAIEGELVPVSLEDVAVAAEKAQELPWDRIAELLPEGELRDSFTEVDTSAVYATATGIVAGFKLLYGVPVTSGATRSSLDDAAPGLELLRGDPVGGGQGKDACYGLSVDVSSYDVPTTLIDFSATAHAERKARLGGLADRAHYYLTTNFD